MIPRGQFQNSDRIGAQGLKYQISYISLIGAPDVEDIWIKYSKIQKMAGCANIDGFIDNVFELFLYLFI